jgi:hypothetical protein
MSYVSETKINRELVLDFFLYLSRFEFALKVTGYARGNETRVDLHWDKFVTEIAPSFSKDRTKELAEACDILLVNPPHKQVIVNGSLGWNTTLPCDTSKEFELIIGLARRVRNNLFHGGKYNAQFHEETARNEALLKAVIVIIEECLHLAPNVRGQFEQAAI